MKKLFFVFILILCFSFLTILMISWFGTGPELTADSAPSSLVSQKNPINVLVFDCEGTALASEVERALALSNGLGLSTDYYINPVREAFSEEKPLDYTELSRFDVLVVPGGYLYKMYKCFVREDVRQWVAAGGGYVGICAGEILAVEGHVETSIFGSFTGFEIAPNIIRKTTDWVGERNVRFSELGTQALGYSGDIRMMEWNGSVFWYKEPPVQEFVFARFYNNSHDLEYFDYWAAAWEDEFDQGAAIIGDYYKKGRVILSGPHPEFARRFGKNYHPGLLAAMVKWAFNDSAPVPVTIGRENKLAGTMEASTLAAQSAYITADSEARTVGFYARGGDVIAMLGVYEAAPGGGPGKLLAQTVPFPLNKYQEHYVFALDKPVKAQKGQTLYLAWVASGPVMITMDEGHYDGDIGDSRIYISGLFWENLDRLNPFLALMPEQFPPVLKTMHRITSISLKG